MSYLVYTNIDVESFDKLKKRIDALKNELDEVCGEYNFSRTADNQDILGLDYTYEDSDYMGNVGFLFDDVPSSKPTFYFYVLKAYDNNGFRYYKRVRTQINVTIESIEKTYPELLKECFETFKGIGRDDMKESIDVQ